MSRFLRQCYQTTAMLMLAVVLLQFAGAGFGAHQLHQGNAQEEEANHTHLQFTAQVATLDQCFEELASVGEHQHAIGETDTQEFDLCLDCQCHGGHISMISQLMMVASAPVVDLAFNRESQYFSPDPRPDYRPPIA